MVGHPDRVRSNNYHSPYLKFWGSFVRDLANCLNAHVLHPLSLIPQSPELANAAAVLSDYEISTQAEAGCIVGFSRIHFSPP
ncbi:hypothetical protein, partial [Neptunomonas sp.]|uniref:hypothetical protein n=1 Tax=Neptunomonas sp. TaxID=1971898 RepID=UPI003569C15A